MSSELLSLVDKKQSFALNVASSASLSALLEAGGAAGAVASDDGAQLLLHLPLLEAVRLDGLLLTVRGAGPGPVAVRLWANRTTFDFADAEALPPAQAWAALPAGGALALRAARFAACTALTIFIDGGAAEAPLVLTGLRLTGSAAGARADVAKIKAVGEHDH